jgi:hypothetical protein
MSPLSSQTLQSVAAIWINFGAPRLTNQITPIDFPPVQMQSLTIAIPQGTISTLYAFEFPQSFPDI